MTHGDAGLNQGAREHGGKRQQVLGFFWLGKQKTDLMSICSGRWKKQDLPMPAPDLLLSSE